MQLSHQLFLHNYRVPDDWRAVSTGRLVELMNLIRTSDPGLPLFPPIGSGIIRRIESVIRSACDEQGFDELIVPSVIRSEYLKGSGRFEKFENEAMILAGEDSHFMLAAAHEEFFLKILRDSNLSPEHLPVRIFQIGQKFRRVKRPKGILRSRAFSMCELLSFDASKASLEISKRLFEYIVFMVFDRLSLRAVRVTKDRQQYVEWFGLCHDGEEKLLESDGEYTFALHNEPHALRAASLGMYMLYEPGAFDGNARGLASSVYIGCYGFGLQKLLHSIVEQHRDELGVLFPSSIRPFDVSVITIGNQPEVIDCATDLAATLRRGGRRVLVDDRSNPSLRDKCLLSDFYGAPIKICIGRRELTERTITVKFRDLETAEETFPMEATTDVVRKLIAHVDGKRRGINA